MMLIWRPESGKHTDEQAVLEYTLHCSAQRHELSNYAAADTALALLCSQFPSLLSLIKLISSECLLQFRLVLAKDNLVQKKRELQGTLRADELIPSKREK